MKHWQNREPTSTKTKLTQGREEGGLEFFWGGNGDSTNVDHLLPTFTLFKKPSLVSKTRTLGIRDA